jgi:hypothetical protein
MAELCKEFGIARKTGYKIFDRYQECGIQGLTHRSRASPSLCAQAAFPSVEDDARWAYNFQRAFNEKLKDRDDIYLEVKSSEDRLSRFPRSHVCGAERQAICNCGCTSRGRC